jgi:hypothetical protein
MARLRKGSYTPHEFFDGRHRFEHWYRDNSVYFITARCAERFPALASDDAKNVFWDRFEHYTRVHTFTPIVTSVLDNHYHVLGYLKIGEELPTMHAEAVRVGGEAGERPASRAPRSVLG